MLQITANVLCTDGQIDPDVVAINAVSAALSISNIPWGGPLAAVRVTRTEMGSADGTLTAAPTLDDQRSSGLNLLYVGTADRALLVDFQVKCTGAGLDFTGNALYNSGYSSSSIGDVSWVCLETISSCYMLARWTGPC